VATNLLLITAPRMELGYTHSHQHNNGWGLQAQKVTFLLQDNSVMTPVLQDGS